MSETSPNSDHDRLASVFAGILAKRFPDPANAADDDRQAFQESLRAALHKRHEGREGQTFYEEFGALEQAISAFEDGRRKAVLAARSDKPVRALDQAVFRFSDVVSSLASKYGALAAAISTVIDFLKPIGDYAVVLMIGAAVVGAGSSIAMRFTEHMRGEARKLALFCAALFVCSGGWLAIGAAIPGAEANGVVARVIPGASDIQALLLDKLSQIAQHTKETSEGVRSIDKRLEKMAEDSDPLVYARKEIEKAGYTLDTAGYLKALADGTGHLPNFHEIKVVPNGSEFRSFLLARPLPGVAVDNVLARVSGASEESVAALREELRTPLLALRGAPSLNGLRAQACGGRPESLLAELLKVHLGKDCADEATWVRKTIDLVGRMLARFAIPGITYLDLTYEPASAQVVPPAEFERLRDTRPYTGPARIIAVSGYLAQGNQALDLYTDGLRKLTTLPAPGVQPADTPCLSGALGVSGVCEVRAFFLLSPDLDMRAIGMTTPQASERMPSLAGFLPKAKPGAAGAVVTLQRDAVFQLPLGPVRSAVLIASQGAGAARLYCDVSTGQAWTVVRFGFGAPFDKLAPELFSQTSSTVNQPISALFDAERVMTTWNTPGRFGQYGWTIGLMPDSVQGFRTKGMVTLSTGGRKVATFNLVSARAAIDAALAGTPCQ